jgi:hypothetical protein
MKIKILVVFSIIFISSMLLFSCVDSEKDNPEIVGTWKVINYESKTQTPLTDWYTADECRFDNLEEFLGDGTWTQYDGTLKCGTNSGGLTKGTWRLAANNQKVIFAYEGFSGEYERTIEQLNETTLILSFASGTLNGLQNRVTYSRN